MIADIYELSPMQAGMLFHRLFAPESQAYFNQFSCRLTGRPDPDRLRRAWQQLVDRHPVLRTSFHWEGVDKPVQVVHTEVTLPWDVLDWRGLSEDEQHARWDALLAADRVRGFQPDVPPLMRGTVAVLSDDECAFCWSHHHLLLDGWCLTLVLGEVFELYDAGARGRHAALPPVRPYGDYIRWLQRRDRTSVERYWRDELRGRTAATPLLGASATVSTPPAPADAVAELSLSTELTEAVRALAVQHRLTLSTLMQGAWAILLSRYSGHDDVVFGATVSGRPPEVPGVETMLGVFVNTVPVRLPVVGDMSAASWLASVQARHVLRESHAAIALSDIQKLSDMAPGAPLFDTNLIVMNYRLDEGLTQGAAGLRISDVRIADQTDIPLTLQVTPGRRLLLEVLYDHATYDAGVATRLLGQVEYLLTQFVEGLERPVSAFNVVTPAERVELMEVFNNTAAPLDPAMTAIHMWETCVAATPEAVALECNDVRLTFRALDEWANRLARGLQLMVPPGVSIGPDTLVAVAFRRSERLAAAILAIWKCGAAYVPIDPDYPSERIRQVIDTATPCLVLRDAGTLAADLEADGDDRIRFASVDDIEAATADEHVAHVAPSSTGADLAYVIFTSGSTGRPKGAMVEQVGMVNHLLAKIEDLQLDHRSVVVQNASHCFDISVWQLFAGMLAGGRTVIYTDDLVLDPARFLERVRTDRVTVLEVVPSYLTPLLDLCEANAQTLPDLQFLLVTGETVKPSLVARWFERFPSIPVVNAYGPTEASDDITHAILRAPATTPTVPVGRPIRNFHIYVVDEHMRLCPIGVAGEVCVSGPGVGRGYLRDPERTAAAFLSDPFRSEPGVRMYRTGDVGWYTSDGTLWLAGRKDHQVKVRGYRIELGDIESALTRLEGVGDAVVVERRDQASGAAALAAYVTLRDQTLRPAGVLEALASRLPEYMIPSTCTVLDRLPLTPNGKVDRRALPAPDASARRDGSSFAAPRTAAEVVLAGIWSDVLGVDQPGIHDNFFAVGGDSILSMQVVSRASRAGLDFTPRDVFQHQTIAALAAVARPTPARVPVTSPRRSGPAPLAPAQAQFFADVTIDRHHYNQSILLEVPADFDCARAERALAALVAHHEALRLRFAEVGGVWQQSVVPVESAPLLEQHSVEALSGPDRAAALVDIGTRVQSTLNLEHGPVLRAAHVHYGDEPGRLLITAHHLVVDGVSWRSLLDDLAMAYDALGRGTPPVLAPIAASYLEWATEAANETLASEARPQSPSTDWPTDVAFDPALNLVESGSEVALTYDEDITRAFVATRALTQGTGPTELLLAAAALAFGAWSGRSHVAIDLETHGRESAGGLDVSRTVGWFTATRPVAFDVSAGAGPREALVQAIAKEAVDRRPSILLNYHGRIDTSSTGWHLAPEAHGPDRSQRQAREYLFEINAFVSEGRLRVTLGFSRHLHGASTMRTLAQQFERHLVSVVHHVRDGSALDQLVSSPGVEDVYPLSPTQHGLLFHALFEHQTEAYFNQLTCVLQGPLDVEAFQRAWQSVVARHAVLRSSFHWKGLEQPVQVVHQTAALPWHIADWTHLPAEAQARQWESAGARDRETPFDLARAPLMRAMLMQTGPATWWFRWSQHHLLLDGWSAAIVLNDVLAAYDALVRGEAVSPTSVPSLRTYIDWLQARDRDADLQYWRRQLEGVSSATPLPLGRPQMELGVQPWRHAEVEMAVPQALTTALKSLSAANHVTLHTLVQGVWALWLSRHSGEKDVVFGSVVSGRPPQIADVDRMVGLFINTVPVRVLLDDQVRVFEWLRHLQQAHADREPYGYSSLAEVQRESGVPGGTPLFESILIFENYPVAAAVSARASTLTVSDVAAREPNNYGLTLVVTPGESIGLKIMFDAGRWDRSDMERTAGHLLMLLSGIAAEPQSPLGALTVLTPAERARIDAWNSTDAPLPEGETVLSLCEAHATRTPERIAIIGDGQRVSYATLITRVNRLARRLQATGRLTREADGTAARVMVMVRRSPQLIETLLAIWRCGAVYVPVDPDYPSARLAAILHSARPSLVVVDAGDSTATAARDALGPFNTSILALDGTDADKVATIDDGLGTRRAAPADVAYVIYTSGSTGVPKGAMVEQAGCLNHVLSMVEDLGLGPGSVVAQTASQSFDISMWQMCAALVAGGTTAIYPDALVRKPEALAAAFTADGVTVAQFVPSYLTVFLDAVSRTAPPVLQTLGHMVVIGEALTATTLARWFDVCPQIPLMNAYGPTEAADSVAHVDFTAAPVGALVPIGRPIRNMSLYVVDEAMRLCPIGVKGEICIAGVGVGPGYLFDTERTTPVFVADPFKGRPQRMYRTGDIGCYRPDGTLLFFGRRDHQVKIRGHRIELGDIESCLASLPGVRDAAVVAPARGSSDRVLCAYVTAHAGGLLDPITLSQGLAELLPSYAIPEFIRVLPEMPVMPSGKIDRRALESFAIVIDEPVQAAGPETETERVLVRLWSSVLHRDQVGVDQSFFDLGGHSLTAIQMVSRLNQELGVDIGVGDVFQHGTIRQLATHVDAVAPIGAASLVRVPDQDHYDTSPTQLRMWLASRTPEGAAAYTMSGIFRLDGHVDAVAMARAFHAVVQRHEALRTVFRVVGGALRQQVLDPSATGEVFRYSDVSTLAGDEGRINALLDARLAVACDLATGPVFHAELIRLTDTSSLLLVRLHHIVGDASSIRIVLREALALYADAGRVLPPLSIQYRDFVAWQRGDVHNQDRDRQFWMTTLNGTLPRSGFVPDHPSAPGAGAAAVVASCELDASLTSRLRTVAAGHGTTVFAGVVSAVYALLYRCIEQTDLIIGSTVSRRDHPLLEAQVGCYIDTLALRGQAGGSDTAGTLLDRTARVCREAIAHRGYSFDALLEDLGVTVPEGATPLFDVLVDYLPGADVVVSADETAGLTIEELPRLIESAHYDSMFLIGESENGATLTIRLVFKAGRFSDDTVALMQTRLQTLLQWIGADGATRLAEVDLHPVPAPPRRRLRIGLNTS